MRRGFGLHDRHSPFRFNPATLFIGGAVKGALYDPSNITTLFQDDVGTTPVTAVEQTVGRVLDLSGNGANATQSVLASRPTYRSRYNLLTHTEEFTNVATWNISNARTLVANTPETTDPLGGNTATKYTTTGASSYVGSTRTFIASSYTYSAYAKKGNTDWVFMGMYDGAADYGASFNLNTGQVGTALGSAVCSMTSVGNGWWRLVVTTTVGATTGGNVIIPMAISGNNTFPTVNGNFCYDWGAQLLTAADVATTGNAYQRVAAATSYDTSSPVWRPYLAFDGSNDSMLTSAIDFTGTNKMTVFAGLTKLLDAAQRIVVELSSTIASNNGAFLLSAPNSAAANYNFSSKGTTQVDNTVTTYTAPNTAVLTGQADIAAPSNIIRVNGAQAGSVATTQGTGNFGNYPLYIGRRNNATLPFNGRLYGLIVLGAAASDWQVNVTEQWMASKTGLQF